MPNRGTNSIDAAPSASYSPPFTPVMATVFATERISR